LLDLKKSLAARRWSRSRTALTGGSEEEAAGALVATGTGGFCAVGAGPCASAAKGKTASSALAAVRRTQN